MNITMAHWQVWIKNYNPSFYKLLAEYRTREEAERVARNLDCYYWDEENGECGLEVVKASKPLLN